jgi:ribosome recycling factor
MPSKTLVDAEERMKKATEFVRHELGGIRTGKASPQLLDTVKVEAYRHARAAAQVGSVSAPEPRPRGPAVGQERDQGHLQGHQRDLGLNPTG